MDKKLKLALAGLGVFVVMIAVLCFMLTRVQEVDASYDHHMELVNGMYQTSTLENDPNYAGLVSGIRTGGKRDILNLTSNEFECTDDGAYFTTFGLYAYVDLEGSLQTWPCSNFFYLDHGSDTVIKLCGRPDCTHQTDQCNSYTESNLGITYYDGYLYFAVLNFSTTNYASLYRMDPDGSNRVKILDTGALNQGQYSGFLEPRFINGVFMLGMSYMNPDTEIPEHEFYYCKLDENKPELKKAIGGYCWTDGEALLRGSFLNDENGDPVEWYLMQWDPDTNTEKVLNTISNVENVEGLVFNTYWGETCGLRHENGKVYKINYPNSEMEILFETGIPGKSADFYPDCIAVWEAGDYQNGKDGVLHFYDYDGNKLGQVAMDVVVNSDSNPLLGESRDRIYIRNNECFVLPTYYIDKSEFGTGEIILHPLEHPDLKDCELNYIFSERGFGSWGDLEKAASSEAYLYG